MKRKRITKTREKSTEPFLNEFVEFIDEFKSFIIALIKKRGISLCILWVQSNKCIECNKSGSKVELTKKQNSIHIAILRVFGDRWVIGIKVAGLLTYKGNLTILREGEIDLLIDFLKC